MVDRIHCIRQWVGCGGLLDHIPIFLELRNGPSQPPSPLKFNKTLLKYESFVKLILDLWIPFNPHSPISAAFQFATNIKGLKGVIKEWAVGKRVREDLELKSVEAEISRILDSVGRVCCHCLLRRHLLVWKGEGRTSCSTGRRPGD